MESRIEEPPMETDLNLSPKKALTGSYTLRLNLETVLVVLILLTAVFSRFYLLGERVMSHDEVNHVVPSFDFFQGRGYRYDPITHGPLQFHLIAFSYFMFGDSDFTSRIPAALFSVATVALALFAFRRYLGRAGSLAAGLMFLISPFMMFYGRYARNEAFIVVWAVLTLYTILRYLERGETKILFLFTLVNALHFTDKATSYIFAAEELLFLAGFLVYRLRQHPWRELRGKGLWQVLRSERVFDLSMLLGTLVLPLLAAFPLQLAGFNPLDTSSSAGVLRAGTMIGLLFVISAILGMWWNRDRWVQHLALFYAVFIPLYTTFFTNLPGMAGGFLGALGYWLQQQGVQRGGQPLYYYAFMQIPLYEYLPAVGTLLALGIGWRCRLWLALPGRPFERVAAPPFADAESAPEEDEARDPVLEKPAEGEVQPVPALPLFLFWSFSSLLAFTFSGEKMPWLTIHIAVSMILAAGWVVGWLAEGADWGSFMRHRAWLALLLLGVMLAALGGAFKVLGEVQAVPAQDMLQMIVKTVPGSFFYLIAALAAAWAAAGLLRGLPGVGRFLTLAGLAFLAVLTVRTAIRAAFINYDYGYEYLVYAHGAPGPKQILKQLEEISRRTTGGLNIVVAYDNNARYPFWWYLRHYPNRIDFDVNPTGDLRRAAVVLAGTGNYDKLNSVLGSSYQSLEYTRLWWPNQDYWNLKWEQIGAEEGGVQTMTLWRYLQGCWRHIQPFFTDTQARNSIWQIWFNRDYTLYAQLHNNQNFTDVTWVPSERMRMYIRKDVNAQALGIPLEQVQAADPYALVRVKLSPEKTVGQLGSLSGQFQSPRSVALASDGSIYVADSGNNRIQHLQPDGQIIRVWGSFSDVSKGEAPGGTFNEPWGVAVGPDGSVYVADTWNHRVQKFNADGQFVTLWGVYGRAERPDAFWGPRGIAVDGQGQVYVADTGNKRIAVFDSSGHFITQLGAAGDQPGQLNEPVGVAVGPDGRVYIADTWNQRVQVFSDEGEKFKPQAVWPVEAWGSQSVEDKPFIAVRSNGSVLVTDPEGNRVIEFSPEGKVVRTFGEAFDNGGGLGLPSGITVDASGVWVSDAANNQLMRFRLTGQ